ncbi:hypothetical protein BH11PAT3_BH11PAT3_0910 [soil metagenome]
MFKLLTDEARQKVSEEYAMRRGVVTLLGVSAVLVVGIVALIPSYVISDSRIRVAEARTDALKNSTTGEKREELVSWLSVTNKKLKILSPGSQTSTPYEYFIKVVNSKPAGIKIVEMEWLKTDTNTQLVIRGSANDRQSLLDFESKLNETNVFSKAVLPVSNFAKDKDIDFELKLVSK